MSSKTKNKKQYREQVNELPLKKNERKEDFVIADKEGTISFVFNFVFLFF